MTTDEIIEYLSFNSHCSGFMKIPNDLNDVWFGHNTCTTFIKLIRIYKKYKYDHILLFL